MLLGISFAALIPFLLAQPWVVLIPILVLVLLDGVLGYVAARKRGEPFSWNRFADFMKNSVGAHQLLYVAGTIAMVYLSGGGAAAFAALVALAGVNSIVYLKVLADVRQKVLVVFFGAPNVPSTNDTTPITIPV